MKVRTYTAQDQDKFAALSGDFNPLHVDPIHARRLMFGAAAVHGIHNLLWALDVWAATANAKFALSSVKAAFVKPVAVGAPVTWSVRSSDQSSARLQLLIGEDVVAKIDFTTEPFADDYPGAPVLTFSPVPPDEHQDYSVLSGQLEMGLDRALARALFPNLMRCIPPRQIAALLASTRIVGMHCPGLHSVYSELSVKLNKIRSGLSYKVARFDPRFAMLTIDMTGSITAFVRPKPRDQSSYAELGAQISKGAFVGQRAVVIGGSRGLGEVTAKLLAAGGAEVLITYNLGAADAQRIVDEISLGGGAASCCAYDVLDTDPNSAAALTQWGATHLYYFATPFIATGKRGKFLMPLFEKFAAYYAGGLTNAIAAIGPKKLKGVYCPSSIFVENPPEVLLEYSAAKSAAEFVAAALHKQHGESYKLYQPRLPKMDTDQTASFTDSGSLNPAIVLKDSLLQFAGVLESA